MKLSIVKKIGWYLFVSTSLTLTITAITQKSNYIYIYAESKELTGTEKTEINNTNYSCVFNERNYACELFDAEAFDAQNQWNIPADNKANAKTQVKNDELKKADKIYKIKIADYIGDWTQQGKFDKNISVVPNSNFKNKYAELKPLFALNSQQKPNKYTITKHFVGRSKKSIANLQDLDKNKCSFGQTALTENTKQCNVELFASAAVQNNENATLSSKTFAKTKITNSSITEHEHYLIELPGYCPWNHFENRKIDSVNYGTDENSKTTFSELTPAIITSKSDKIFILPKN